MNKKELFIPIIVVVLSIAFALISLVVILTKGKSKKWIQRKMKLGALLLTLNAFTPGSAQEIEIMCYKAMISSTITIESDNFSFSKKDVIKGNVEKRQVDTIYYSIRNNNGTAIQGGKLITRKETPDSPDEKFEIELVNDLAKGKYSLLFFATYRQWKRNEYPLEDIKIKINE